MNFVVCIALFLNPLKDDSIEINDHLFLFTSRESVLHRVGHIFCATNLLRNLGTKPPSPPFTHSLLHLSRQQFKAYVSREFDTCLNRSEMTHGLQSLIVGFNPVDPYAHFF